MDGFTRLALIVSLAMTACGCHSLVASRDLGKAALADAAANTESPQGAASAAASGGAAPQVAGVNSVGPGAAAGIATASDGQGTPEAAPSASHDQIKATLDQLQAQGKLTPEARQRMQNDLAQCDPTLLPGLLRMLQGSLEGAGSGETQDQQAASAGDASLGGAAADAAEQPTSSRRWAINGTSVRNPYADVVPGSEDAAEPTGAVQLATAESEVPSTRQPGEPAPFPEVRQTPANKDKATRRLPPPPEEVFKAYETLLAAYPDTGAPELLAAISAARPIPKPSAGPVVQAFAEESPSGAGRSHRGNDTVLASFARDTNAGVEPAAGDAASQGMAAAGLQDASWQELLTAFIARLETTSAGPAETADQLRQQVYLRLLYVMAGRREEALEPIAGLSLAEQEFWNKFIYGLATYLDENRIPNRQLRAAEARQYFRDAAVRLGELASLEVRGLTFCTAVQSFGVVEPFPSNSFKPGDMVLLYAELDNYVAQRQAEGFRTEFRASYLIFDRLGRPVETEPHVLPVVTETCQNLRHDFFISYQVELPARMNPGEHKLQLTVHDMVGDKIGTAEVKFVVEP